MVVLPFTPREPARVWPGMGPAAAAGRMLLRRAQGVPASLRPSSMIFRQSIKVLSVSGGVLQEEVRDQPLEMKRLFPGKKSFA